MSEVYSPLRYPGGKAKLAPFIKYLINTKLNGEIDTYIEPFAGGAGVALDLLMNGTVENIIINDYDKSIYSFWKAILLEPNRFIQQIMNTDVSIDEWKKQKVIYDTQKNKYSFELGFATFFLNRTNRSGILTAGPIGGYNQDGNYLINARYNNEMLAKKVDNISKYKKFIKVYNKDIRSFITQIIFEYQRKAFIYFDPPYYSKGKELYKNHFQMKDHQEVHDLITDNIDFPWIITYDDEQCITDMYREYLIKRYNLVYSLANKGISSEIMIFSDDNLCPKNNELILNKIKTKLI